MTTTGEAPQGREGAARFKRPKRYLFSDINQGQPVQVRPARIYRDGRSLRVKNHGTNNVSPKPPIVFENVPENCLITAEIEEPEMAAVLTGEAGRTLVATKCFDCDLLDENQCPLAEIAKGYLRKGEGKDKGRVVDEQQNTYIRTVTEGVIDLTAFPASQQELAVKPDGTGGMQELLDALGKSTAHNPNRGEPGIRPTEPTLPDYTEATAGELDIEVTNPQVEQPNLTDDRTRHQTLHQFSGL